MIWPDGYAVDSVALHLDVMSDNPYEHAPELRATLFPVFTAKGMSRTPAVEVELASASYPADAIADSITGRVTLDVVVGTNGLPDSATLRVREPSAAVLDTARLAHYYREFIDASRDRVLRTRFRPARIGGCTIRQLVHLSFNYIGRNPTSSP